MGDIYPDTSAKSFSSSTLKALVFLFQSQRLLGRVTFVRVSYIKFRTIFIAKLNGSNFLIRAMQMEALIQVGYILKPVDGKRSVYLDPVVQKHQQTMFLLQNGSRKLR